ncbi:MAG: hypothetical protein M1334_03470, partial [Patescibacteria group bacterium]|nr:hypothetical protein [Patescibacteria group bacterium]
MDIGAIAADLLDFVPVVGWVISIPVYIFNYTAILLIYLFFFLKGSYGTASTAALITGFGI